METKYIDVGDGKWGVIVCYDFDLTDWDEMAATMESFGLNRRSINKAMKVLSNFNTGMALSKQDLRMSIIYISNTTSVSEWWSTALHELRHVADTIIDYYDVEWDGEDAAYLTGYLTKELVELAGCPCRISPF